MGRWLLAAFGAMAGCGVEVGRAEGADVVRGGRGGAGGDPRLCSVVATPFFSTDLEPNEPARFHASMANDTTLAVDDRGWPALAPFLLHALR